MVRPEPPPVLPALPLQQSPVYASALAALGAMVEDVRVPDGRAVVVSRRFLGLRVRLVTRGPVWDAGAYRPGGLRALARSGPLLVTAEGTEDGTDLREAGFRQVMTPVHVAELDLRSMAEALRAGLAGSWRNALRQGEARGLHLANKPFRADRDGWLLTAEAAQRQAKRYRALPPALVPAMAAAAPEDVRVLTARAGGASVAGLVLVRHGGAATWHLGWTGPEGRALRATHVLLWQGILWARSHGLTRLDLGTVTDAAPGVMRFKLGTGARVRPLGGTWARLIPPWR